MTSKASTTPKRRGRRPSAQLSRPDYPYTMRLPDGRVIYVEVPGRWTTQDRDGTTAFLPAAVRFLDRLRVLAMSPRRSDRPPSPAFIATLRHGLGLTQAQMGQRIGVDRLTVSRWERGELRPSPQSVAGMERLRRDAVRRGVTLAA